MSISAPVSPPPLREGDRLNADEFMRRWEVMPDLKYAELIDGIVFMPSPLSRRHSVFHYPLSGWFLVYVAHTPGCEAGSDETWLMADDSAPQPDLALFVLPEFGGQSRLKGDYSLGAPELIVEVALSRQPRDLGRKLKLYERMGVREYLVAVVGQKKLIWHEQSPNGFQTISPDADGIYRSQAFPGLWLDSHAYWRGDKLRFLAVLQQGIESPEHAAFVARLAKIKSGGC